MGNDLAFISYVEGEDQLEFIPVGQARTGFDHTKGPSIGSKEEIDLLDTVEYDYVYFTKNSGLRRVMDSCFSRIKRQPTIAYEGEEDSSVAGLVAAGFGIAIVPKIPLLDTMDVCVRPIISPEIERYIYLVLKKEKYLTPVVKDFISFITKQSEFA